MTRETPSKIVAQATRVADRMARRDGELDRVIALQARRELGGAMLTRASSVDDDLDRPIGHRLDPRERRTLDAKPALEAIG